MLPGNQQKHLSLSLPHKRKCSPPTQTFLGLSRVPPHERLLNGQATSTCYNMYYVTRDAYVTTSLWRINVVLVIRHLELVLWSSLLYTLDNVALILLHGGSDTELTFNSDYCCHCFLVKPSRTSLFFEQCLLLYSSVITTCYHLWKLPSSHFSLLC